MDKVNLVLTGLLAFFVYACFYRWVLHRNRRGPKVWPLLGSWLELGANKYHLYEWLQPYFEKYSTVSIPSITFHFVTTVDPACVEYTLKTNFNNYPKGEVTHLLSEELLGDGIINVDGDLWKTQRKTGSYAFSHRVLRDSSTTVSRDGAVKLCSILARAALNAQPLDMQDICRRIMLEDTCKVDTGLGAEVGSKFAESLDAAAKTVTARFTNPVWKLARFLRVGSEGALHRHMKVLDDFIYKLIDDRLAQLENSAPVGTQVREEWSDVISCYIVEARDDIAAGSTNLKALRDTVLSLTIASHVTSATTLSWLLYLVCCHPEVEEKIVQELLEFGREFASDVSATGDEATRIRRFADAVTYEALSRMHYLHAAVTETVRLYPAVPLSSKVCQSDDTLPDGTRLKKGDMVAYAPYCMARLKRLWGDDAPQFRPERWLKDGVFQPESPFKFSSFHAGPRTCMGKDYAYLQIKMKAAILLRFYKFQLVPGHTVQYDNTLVLAIKHGLRMTVSKRNTC